MRHLLLTLALCLWGAPALAHASRGCTGSADCRVCTNCRYCRHCAQEGGHCGVCAPSRHEAAVARVAAPHRSRSRTATRAQGLRPTNPSGYGDHVHSLAALLVEVSKVRFANAGEFDGRTRWELTLVRNAPYARHGYRFHDAKLLAYFKQQAWYHPTWTIRIACGLSSRTSSGRTSKPSAPTKTQGIRNVWRETISPCTRGEP